MKARFLILPLAAAASAHAGEHGKSSVVADKTPVMEEAARMRPQWRISVGPVYRGLGGVSWNNGRSLSSGFFVPSLVGSPHDPTPGAAGPEGAYADRNYSDGFVWIGSPTEMTGDTWNWGYQNASQAAGDSLAFHGSGGSSATYSNAWSGDLSSDWNDEVNGWGPQISADLMFQVTPAFVLGPQLSFFWIPWDSGREGSTFSGVQELRSFQNVLIDRYGLDGSIPPEAPYSGSYKGPGLLLRNQPDARHYVPRQTGVSRADIINNVREHINLDVYTFSAGIQAGFQRGPVSVRAGTGLALDIADVDAERMESLVAHTESGRRTLAKWSDHYDDTEVVPGLYVSLEAACSLSQNLAFSVFGRYDWRDEIEGQVGPSHFEVDLTGWTVGGAVSWRW